jgi:hypothetical protein
MGGSCSTNGGEEECIKVTGGKARGKETRLWVDNNRTDLGEVGWDDVDWTGLAQDTNRWRALVNLVLNFQVP